MRDFPFVADDGIEQRVNYRKDPEIVEAMGTHYTDPIEVTVINHGHAVDHDHVIDHIPVIDHDQLTKRDTIREIVANQGKDQDEYHKKGDHHDQQKREGHITGDHGRVRRVELKSRSCRKEGVLVILAVVTIIMNQNEVTKENDAPVKRFQLDIQAKMNLCPSLTLVNRGISINERSLIRCTCGYL